jgi:hypothetical protein
MDMQTPNDAIPQRTLAEPVPHNAASHRAIGKNCRLDAAASAGVSLIPAASKKGPFVLAADRLGCLSLAKYGTYAPCPAPPSGLKFAPHRPAAYELRVNEELTN